jgi:outer membrane receptor protein involved in Fe transport
LEHLPSHTTFDLSLGKSFGERWNIRLTGLNLSNHRYLLDSNIFGGTHYVNPREISVQLKYRFHFSKNPGCLCIGLGRARP